MKRATSLFVGLLMICAALMACDSDGSINDEEICQEQLTQENEKAETLPDETVNGAIQSSSNIELLDGNSVNGGTAIIHYKKNENEFTGIINSAGKIIYSCEDKYINWTSIGGGAGYLIKDDEYTVINAEGQIVASSSNGDFDKIIGSGDGLILVYKNTSTISSQKHSYGVKAYIYPSDDYESRLRLPEHFVLRTDGTFDEAPEFNSETNGVLVNTEGEYIRICDGIKGTSAEYAKYPSSLIKSVEFLDDYGLILLNGADGKTYFTVIDKMCVQQFEPIAYDHVNYSNEGIVYNLGSSYYEMLDVKGNVIISKEAEYTFIGKFSDGIAQAEKNNEECYINDTGTVIAIKEG